MRMRLQTTCLALACFAAALACEKPATPTPAPPSEPAAPTQPTAPTATAPLPTEAPALSVDLETVPAREDFEQEASAAITPVNLEKQLQALEKEMTGD